MTQPLNIKHIEQVMKLMTKYGIDEYASEHFSLKKSEHKTIKARKPYTKKKKVVDQVEADQDFLDSHTAPPLDNEPWNQIDQSTIDLYAINGRLGG